MNNKLHVAKNSILKQKKIYLILLILIGIGIISGFIFMFILNKSDKTIVIDEMNSFFNTIKTGEGINYSKSLINSLLKNVIYILTIWLLGLSVIGFPFVLLILFFKSFILGFSISSIISIYGLKGILGAFLYIFPHQIVNLVLFLLISFYSLSFSYRLFSYLFLKKIINFKSAMNKYIKVLGFSLLIGVFISFYEIYLSTYFMKLFTLLLK